MDAQNYKNCLQTFLIFGKILKIQEKKYFKIREKLLLFNILQSEDAHLDRKLNSWMGSNCPKSRCLQDTPKGLVKESKMSH